MKDGGAVSEGLGECCRGAEVREGTALPNRRLGRWWLGSESKKRVCSFPGHSLSSACGEWIGFS